jgi:hypothetical protein
MAPPRFAITFDNIPLSEPIRINGAPSRVEAEAQTLNADDEHVCFWG